MLLQLNPARKLVSLTLAALLFTAVSAAPIANVDVHSLDCVKVDIPSISGDQRFVHAGSDLSVKIDVSGCDPSVANRVGPARVTLIAVGQGDPVDVDIVGGLLLFSFRNMFFQALFLMTDPSFLFWDQHSRRRISWITLGGSSNRIPFAQQKSTISRSSQKSKRTEIRDRSPLVDLIALSSLAFLHLDPPHPL